MNNSIVIFSLLIAALCIFTVNADTSEKCANWKKCSKDLRKVSGLNEEGNCVTYNNMCLLKHAVLCEEKTLSKCFRGPSCGANDENVISCSGHQQKPKDE